MCGSETWRAEGILQAPLFPLGITEGVVVSFPETRMLEQKDTVAYAIFLVTLMLS